MYPSLPRRAAFFLQDALANISVGGRARVVEGDAVGAVYPIVKPVGKRLFEGEETLSVLERKIVVRVQP